MSYHGISSRLLYCRNEYIYNCTFMYYLSFSWTCAVSGIALNDPSGVYSASVSSMDSTDNLTMEERAAM